MSSEQARLIKKYPNRRLYDTKTSAYITLSDVKELVLKYENFKVLDAKTEEDLTRSILLQIILEEETGGLPIFTSELLAQLVRFYGNAMQGMFGKYLENNLKNFVDFQHKIQEQSRGVFGENPQMQTDFWNQFLTFQQPVMNNMMNAYVEQNSKMVQHLQEQLNSKAMNIFAGLIPKTTGKD